jgi:dTDP-4-amino-4,6-dideoxygalactose transaminase
LNLFNKKRRLIADNYLKKINNKLILLPHIEKNVYHVFHLFVVRVLKNKRKSLLEYLNKNKIFPGIHYELPNHLQTPYKKYHKGSLKKTESI